MVGSWCFAVFSVLVLVITFYFSIVGLGLLVGAPSANGTRFEGAALLFPSIVLVLWLVGLLPWLRGASLLWLGVGTHVLLLPLIVTLVRMGFPAALGLLVPIGYSAAWWWLVRSRLVAD